MVQPASSKKPVLTRYHVVAAIVLVAACIVAIGNIHTVLAWHVAVPFSDEWGQFPRMIALEEAGSSLWTWIAYLWKQHNEHRIVVPKLIYLMDMHLFNYQGYVPIVFIFLLQASTVAMLGWLLAGKGLASWEIWLLVALFIAAAFNLMQSENFASTFQTAFVGCFSFAVAAFVLYAKYTENGRRSHLAGTALFGILAGLSLAAGLFVWVVLALLAFLLHPRRYLQSLAFSVVFAAFLLLYLAGYRSPRYHADPVESLLRHPWAVAEFLIAWLGNIAGTPSSAKILGFLAVLGLAAVTLYAVRFGKRRVEIYTLLGICAFVVLCGLATAVSRINFGLEQAMASRYMTPVLLFWVCLASAALLTAMERLGPLDVGVVVGLVFVAFAALTVRNSQGSMGLVWFQDQLLRGYLAVVTGGYKDKPDLLTALYPVPRQIIEKGHLDRLRAHNLSSFYTGQASPLPIGSDIPPGAVPDPAKCLGNVDAVTPIASQTLQLTGWAWDESARSYPEWILIVRNGKVIGLGKPGGWRPDVAAAVPSVGKPRVGWQAYAAGSAEVGLRDVEAYLPMKGGGYCRI